MIKWIMSLLLKKRDTHPVQPFAVMDRFKHPNGNVCRLLGFGTDQYAVQIIYNNRGYDTIKYLKSDGYSQSHPKLYPYKFARLMYDDLIEMA